MKEETPFHSATRKAYRQTDANQFLDSGICYNVEIGSFSNHCTSMCCIWQSREEM